MKNLNEESMSFLENRIPVLAEGAVNQAYCKAMASGRNVVETVNAKIGGHNAVLCELICTVSLEY